MPARTSKLTAILADPNVRRWYDNLARGAQASADINARRLAAFCESAKLTPPVIARASERRAYDALLDFVAREEKRGVAGSYVVRTVKAVKSWLAFNGVTVTRKIRVRGAQDTPTLKDERVPTREELRQILLAGNSRTRVCAALVAQAGVRLEVLGNYRGDDGLRLGDIPELRIQGRRVTIATSPTLIRVRPELSKTAHGYVTFLAAEGAAYLKSYLEERLRSGERLTSETDLIHPERANKRFIRTLNVGDGIRSAIRAAGFKWRPYVLRAFFDTQVLLAESKGKVARDYRVFWMGHAGSMDARYTTHKGRLPDELLEDMRAAYRRAEPELSTGSRTTSEERDDLYRRALILFAKLKGMSDEEIKKLDAETIPVADLEKAVGKIVAPPAQRVAGIADVPGLLAAGFEYVGPLGADRVILKSPNGNGSAPPQAPGRAGRDCRTPLGSSPLRPPVVRV